ncbi:MAG: DUF2752 domain-containing protein [Clostridia bacterium]|nr:DUF2752 domain-containing protein [Clostridia bacterium]
MLKKRTEKLIILLDSILLFFAIFAQRIASFMLQKLPDCYFAAHKIPCPSCGGTRCVYNFFSGNILDAFCYNQFIFFLIIYLIIIFAFLNLGYLFKVEWSKMVFKKITHYKVIISIALLYALFGILRIFL